jgi:hypothetical protein
VVRFLVASLDRRLGRSQRADGQAHSAVTLPAVVAEAHQRANDGAIADTGADIMPLQPAQQRARAVWLPGRVLAHQVQEFLRFLALGVFLQVLADGANDVGGGGE